MVKAPNVEIYWYLSEIIMTEITFQMYWERSATTWHTWQCTPEQCNIYYQSWHLPVWPQWQSDRTLQTLKLKWRPMTCTPVSACFSKWCLVRMDFLQLWLSKPQRVSSSQGILISPSIDVGNGMPGEPYSDLVTQNLQPHDIHDDVPHEQAEDIFLVDTITRNPSDGTTENMKHEN